MKYPHRSGEQGTTPKAFQRGITINHWISESLKLLWVFPFSKCGCIYAFCVSANAAQNTTGSLIV